MRTLADRDYALLLACLPTALARVKAEPGDISGREAARKLTLLAGKLLNREDNPKKRVCRK